MEKALEAGEAGKGREGVGGGPAAPSRHPWASCVGQARAAPLAQLLGYEVVLSLPPAQECSGLGWGAARRLSGGSEGLHPVVHACGVGRVASYSSCSVTLQPDPACLLGPGTCWRVPLGRDKNLQAQFPD